MINKIINLVILFFCLALSQHSYTQSKTITLNSATRLYLEKEVVTISKNERAIPANWEQVVKQVKHKRIVLLGELNHGAGEMFALRNDLITNIHNKIGPFVLLFESGIGELAYVEVNKNSLSPSQMTRGLFGNWRTREFEELMQFAKLNNIAVAGFDVQRTGSYFHNLLQKVATEKSIDSNLYANLEQRYGIMQQALGSRKAVYDSLKYEVANLVNDYQHAYDLLAKNSNNKHSPELQFTLRTLGNRMNYLSYMLQFVKDRDFKKRFATRDSMMAANITWLAENIYKKEKLIVIAHNYHIAKSNASEQVMGQLLSGKYGSEMYCVGFFGGNGSYFGNSGKPETMAPADSLALDIKHIINHLPGSASFLNIPQKKGAGDEWLREPIIVNDSFIDLAGTNRMVLSALFDGIIMIRNISPPRKDQ